MVALADDIRIVRLNSSVGTEPLTLPLSFDLVLDGALASWPLYLALHEVPRVMDEKNIKLQGKRASALSLWESLCVRGEVAKEAPEHIMFDEASALDGLPLSVPGQDSCLHAEQLKLEELSRGSASAFNLRMTEEELDKFDKSHATKEERQRNRKSRCKASELNSHYITSSFHTDFHSTSYL